jgi:chemotaxis protein MotA
MISGGHVHALIHPTEILTIGGAAVGAMIVMAPVKVLKDLMLGCIQALKGSPFNKKAYEELFKATYELFRLARRQGMLALEPHLNDPHHSSIFEKYPTIVKNHHVTEFLCGLLMPVMDGSVSPDRLPHMAEAELKAMEDEHHHPISVLSKTADALPGFGIVAAVLGIVITMGAIDGPVEEIGHKVGAALVGTFLGILLSYGFFAPMVVKLEFMGAAEMAYFRTVTTIVHGFVTDLPPKVAIEMARRGLGSDVRPSGTQLEEMFKAVEAA